MKCKVCGQEYPSEYYFNEEGVCIECTKKSQPEESKEESKKESAEEKKPASNASETQIRSIDAETKYPALRVISGILKVLAILIGIAAVIGLIYGLVQLDKGYYAKASAISAITSSLVSGISVLILLAFSEIIKLFIDLEGNSRKQITILNQILDKKQNI